MRNAFAEEITKIAEKDQNVMLLSGDIGNKLFDSFKSVAPTRLYNCGVAEANMTGAAAGLAMMGFRPFTYSITPFVTVRCLEQIRVDLCYHDLPVTIVGTGAGLSYAELGPTHHSCEDIGILRTLPNLTILCPCDAMEVQAAMHAIMKLTGPVYLRLGKKGEARIHDHVPDFTVGQPITIRDGTEVVILSVGNMMSVALGVANQLSQSKINPTVMSFHTIKPLNEEILMSLFEKYSAVVAIEEHSIIGGLGSALAEWMIDNNETKTRLLRFGTKDTFLPCIGSQVYAQKFYGLTIDNITTQILAKLI